MGFGDELLVTGRCRILQQTDPRKVRLEYGKKLWNEVFNHNPRIALYDEDGDFQVYRPRPNGLRQYCSAKSDRRWTWLPYRPEVGELYFDRHEIGFSSNYRPAIIIEPNIKNRASPNKLWPLEYWQKLVILLNGAGLRVFQLGPRRTPVVTGARIIETPNFRHAAAVLKNARAAVLTEGGMAHAAAVVGVRSVVIMGGYISPVVIGYDRNSNLFVHDDQYPLGCGMRVHCRHCEKAMRSITPEHVFEELKKLI